MLGERGSLVRFDDIIDALRSLDQQNSDAKYKKTIRRRSIFGRTYRTGDSGGSGHSLH